MSISPPPGLTPELLAWAQANRPAEEVARLVELAEQEAALLKYQWVGCGRPVCDGEAHEGLERKHARPEQLPPADDWHVHAYIAGRGAGKTHAGAGWLAGLARNIPETRYAGVAPTFSDGRDTCVECVTGLLSKIPPSEIQQWNRSIGELILKNGSRIRVFSADEPDRLRGPQFHAAWCDELSSFRYDDAWDQLQFGLRLGQKPQVFVTTTPKPTKLVRALLTRDDGTVSIARGSTFDNAANLAPSALEELKRRYEGTRLGRQELYGELLLDVPGAVATFAQLDGGRRKPEEVPDFLRVLVSVDPAVTNTADSDETGISILARGVDGHCYYLADWSCRLDVDDWAERSVSAAVEYHAGMILYEKNQGHDTIGSILRHAMDTLEVRDIVIDDVNAEKSKWDRAMSLQQWIQQERFHLVGSFPELEGQLTSFTADHKGKSPDRADSAVHGFRKLMLESDKPKAFFI